MHWPDTKCSSQVYLNRTLFKKKNLITDLIGRNALAEYKLKSTFKAVVVNKDSLFKKLRNLQRLKHCFASVFPRIYEHIVASTF